MPLSIESISIFSNFSGDAEELIAACKQLGNEIRLKPDGGGNVQFESALEPFEGTTDGGQDIGNERLLRHYVSLSVVDRPIRRGRGALYGYRHLLQFLTARRLLLRGFSLAKIAEYTSIVPTQDLANALVSTPNSGEAELLVNAYEISTNQEKKKQAQVNSQEFTEKNIVHGYRSTSPVLEPMHGVADLLNEVEKMRYRFTDEITGMQSEFHKTLHTMRETLGISRAENDLQNYLKQTEMIHHNILEVASRSSDASEELLHRVREMTSRIEEMTMRMIKSHQEMLQENNLLLKEFKNFSESLIENAKSEIIACLTKKLEDVRTFKTEINAKPSNNA